jgi:hypothetical protein
MQTATKRTSRPRTAMVGSDMREGLAIRANNGQVFAFARRTRNPLGQFSADVSDVSRWFFFALAAIG